MPLRSSLSPTHLAAADPMTCVIGRQDKRLPVEHPIACEREWLASEPDYSTSAPLRIAPIFVDSWVPGGGA